MVPPVAIGVILERTIFNEEETKEFFPSQAASFDARCRLNFGIELLFGNNPKRFHELHVLCELGHKFRLLHELLAFQLRVFEVRSLLDGVKDPLE